MARKKARTIAAVDLGSNNFHMLIGGVLNDEMQNVDRVKKTALALIQQRQQGWKLNDATAPKMLAWAAALHELGQIVGDSGTHKHRE